jgi:nuclear transport factor 2 (NTF2) superfamily protein
MNSTDEKVLELCFAQINSYLKDGDLKWFKELSDKDIVGLHHTLGGRLRNDLNLWHDSEVAKWFQSLGLHHADDMSTIIMVSYHRKLNDKPILLDEQVEYYLNWWAKPENERYG